MNHAEEIKNAQEKFSQLLSEQFDRIDRMKAEKDFIDYSKLDTIEIGIVGGDGIGPSITAQAQRILEFLLKDEVEKGKVAFRVIDGCTIEHRAEVGKALPDDVLAELKKCHVILKGPTTTPRAGDPWPNIESANVAMRKELDLFANVRPVKVPEQGIDWTFYRENTEGAYAVGSKGVHVNDDLAIDFTVTTKEGSERIAKAAFEYAKKAGKTRVTAVTKANVVKTTDGKFLQICQDVAKDYPGIELDDWYIDIMTAKLVDPKRRTQFQVLVLPNLYGDILTDEAAEFQGGVGTSGSAPRMVAEGRAKYADPCSIIRADVMLLEHIGYADRAKKLERALDICMYEEKKLVITGRDTGATGEEFADYVMETIQKL